VSTGSEAAEGEGGKPAASPSANSKPKKKQRGVSPKEPHHPQVQPEKPPAEKATATMDEASLEAIAMTMIDEFKNSVNEGDVAGLVVENFKQVGTPNHKGLVNQAIQYATRSLVKHAGTRLLLAEILMHLTCEPDKESKARHYSVSMDAVVEGFRLFFINAIELGFMEDNPKLWDCFADLIVQCLETEALSFSDLNFCIPDAFVQQDEIYPCLVALFKCLKAQPNAIDLVCTGHFDALQKLFCTNKTAERIDRLLQLLAKHDCLEVDPSVYIYYAFKTEIHSDALLQWLQDHIPEPVACSEVVTLKVAAPTILYSCVASNVAQERRDPRVLFQKFLDLFNKQLIKPILKYTQNINPTDKLENELQCLLEARRFCCITKLQSGVLCNFFQVFYELEIVTEDTYYLWRERDARRCDDLALNEVQSFLSFLENGDAELGEEEEAQMEAMS
jgi:hypothetical protein